MIALLRILKFAFQDVARNLGLSLMTIFILILMLLSLNTLWSLDVTTKEAIKLAKAQVNMSLYLAPTVDDKGLTNLQKYLRSLSEVTAVDVLSRQDVLESFKRRHQLSPEILDALKELDGNPFGPTIIIRAREPEDYKKISAALELPEYERLVEGKSFAEHEEALTRIQNITNRIEKIGLGLTVLFAVIAFLIIFNTIRVAIHTQRREIGIKRLVGASNWFIRGPYLVEAVIFTAASILFTIILIYFGLKKIDLYISVVFSNGFALTNYYQSHMLYVFGIQAAAVFVLTLISSSLAMRQQLKV